MERVSVQELAVAEEVVAAVALLVALLVALPVALPVALMVVCWVAIQAVLAELGVLIVLVASMVLMARSARMVMTELVLPTVASANHLLAKKLMMAAVH